MYQENSWLAAYIYIYVTLKVQKQIFLERKEGEKKKERKKDRQCRHLQLGKRKVTYRKPLEVRTLLFPPNQEASVSGRK